MPLRLPRKLDRLVHEAYAAACLRIGHPLTFTDKSPAMIGNRVLTPAAETTWANPFEDDYYANTSERIAAHAATRLLELSEVCVTGSESFLFSDSRTVLRLCASLDQHPVRKIRRPLRALALRIDEPVFLLGGRAPGNRGHFLVEHLPRLLLAQQAMGNHFPRKVLVTPGHGSWQREYLHAFGFPGLEVIEASPGTTWCRQAWTVPNLSRNGNAELCPPSLYRDLVARLGTRPSASGQRTPLFITRKDAPGRRLANEDAIFAIAQRFLPDIQRVSLAGMTVTQQIELFANASAIIGPHSQAFRGALYARDSLIVQLVPGERSVANEYRFWADNYSLLGTLKNNRPISLYADDAHAGANDSTYPAERFTMELPDLLQRARQPTAS